MKRVRLILSYIFSDKLWLIALSSVDLFFVFLAWLAYAETFHNLVGLMAFVVCLSFVIPLSIQIFRHHKQEQAFQRFLSEPDETNEYLLCEVTSAVLRPYIHDLGKRLRSQQEELDTRSIQLADYENYIENWTHEIKKPLSLMTLVLDNRKDEISPLVQGRMLYIRDHIRQYVEQILYFSRLRATHKDYYWEQLSIMSICKEAVIDNSTLLEEAGFIVEFIGEEYQVISDKKGLMFIIGQIISNSVKYAIKNETSSLRFLTQEDATTGNRILSIVDNGPGIPTSDLPFIFDKGFTGNRGTYLSRSTGMGLYLVQKMAEDLAIEITVQSKPGDGTAFNFIFPKVQFHN